MKKFKNQMDWGFLRYFNTLDSQKRIIIIAQYYVYISEKRLQKLICIRKRVIDLCAAEPDA